jgi:hypothetical protein
MSNVGVAVSDEDQAELLHSFAMSPAADDDGEGSGSMVTADPYPSVHRLVVPFRTSAAGTGPQVQADHSPALMPQVDGDLDPSWMAGPSFPDCGGVQPGAYRSVVVPDRADADPVGDPRVWSRRQDHPHVLGALIEAITMDSDLEDMEPGAWSKVEPDRATRVVVPFDCRA